MSYTEGEIVGFNESSLVIYRYDNSFWYPLNSCLVDTSLKTVSALTKFISVKCINGPVFETTCREVPIRYPLLLASMNTRSKVLPSSARVFAISRQSPWIMPAFSPALARFSPASLTFSGSLSTVVSFPLFSLAASARKMPE